MNLGQYSTHLPHFRRDKMTKDIFYGRIYRVQVQLETVQAEKDTLVICHCPYCDDVIIGWVYPASMHTLDRLLIKTKANCEHFEFFTPGEITFAVFNPPAPF